MKLPQELQFIQNSLKPQHTTHVRVDGKICVITGTTSGVGYEAAKRLAQGGAHLVMINRNYDKACHIQDELSKAYGVDIDLVTADFQNLSEVADAASEIREKFPKIDVLINNAGVYNKRRRLTPDGNEQTFGVIHLASYLLTRLLLEPLINAAPSRVLFISSEAHRFGGFSLKDPNWDKRPYIGMLAYGAAKIAQIHTTKIFAERFSEKGISFNIMHPGAVRTNIGMNNGLFYRLYSRYIVGLFLKDPAQSGEAIYYLTADPSQDFVTGKYFNQTIEEEPAWYAVREDLSQSVWDYSKELVQPFLRGHQ